jgi:hypothetical protein
MTAVFVLRISDPGHKSVFQKGTEEIGYNSSGAKAHHFFGVIRHD